jgi:hypothetical protein
MRRLVLPFAIALIASVSVALHAQSPNPNQPFVQSITYGGTGCPQGSVGQSVANDRMSFELIFDGFVASSGPGVPITESRKNCQVNVNVRVPNGSGQYCAVLDYRGYTQLPAGMTSEQRAIYYNNNNGSYELPDGQVIEIGPIAERFSEFTGPVAKDYLSRDSVDLTWSGGEPVVTPLNINAQVRLFGSGQGQITTDSISGKLTLGACEGADATAPSITIANPIAQGLYGLGATVTPVFTCQDEGSGVASCTAAPVIDTTAIGPKTFTVTAIDNAGNTSTASVTYEVGGKNECKGGGHSRFLAPAFKNQGQCVSSFVK